MNIIVLQQKRGDDCKNNGRSKYKNDIFGASDHEGTEIKINTKMKATFLRSGSE